MADPLLNQLDDLIGGSFSLDQSAFQTAVDLPAGQTAALLVVLTAGLSLAVGQSIILFINQVQPLRFVFSLLLNAVLFTCGFLFLVFSTWLIGWIPGLVHVPWRDLVTALGLGYAPLGFSFLAALPYLGVPIFNLLSVWHLLAMVVGFSAIANVSGADAFVHVAFGWVMLRLLEGTVGQPIAQLGRGLAQRVAGVDLANNRSELKEKVRSGPEKAAVASPAQQAAQAAAFQPESAVPASFQLSTGAATGVAALQMPNSEVDLGAAVAHRVQRIPQVIQLGAILLGMVLLFALVAVLLRPVRDSLFGWHENLPRLVRWTFDLIWIGLVSLIFAGLLAPLETLGWWAGWYGEDLETQEAELLLAPSQPETREQPSRYVIYVDGVGQSGEAYTPDVEEFIEALQVVLPSDMTLVQGLMMYSVRNQALNQDRPLAWLWRLADRMRWQNPMALLGLLVNIRNAWIVALSADKRYGPLYNQGIAQVLYNGLIRQGYQPQSGVPLTLVGYSGGAQMSVAATPYLKRALGSEIEVISLGGVMSANVNFLKLSHLYHLVGDKDSVAKLGPLLFAGRRKWFPLSYWNRAKRKGKISQISLGPMGHQVPGGIMDPNAYLPEGESHLQHTIGLVLSILKGQLLVALPQRTKQISNYEHYQQADFNHYSYYPLDQTVDPQLYRPIAPWMGRLILPQPEERQQLRGVWFEVHHAEPDYEALVGQRVILRWVNEPTVKNLVRAVTHDVHFSVDATYSSQYGGTIHPVRLNHWQQVGPLESLAGSHPVDDLIVMLTGRVALETENGCPVLRIAVQPVEVTGRYYGLVRFEAPVAGTDRFRVSHFNAASRQFDGAEETLRLPQVLTSQSYGSYPSTTNGLEQMPLNEAGWYIYGAKDANGLFVVRALGPRSLFRLQPDRVVFGNKPAYRYIRRESWADIVAQKGKLSSVLCVANPQITQNQAAIDDWRVGDRALLLHVYGGIGGNNREPAAKTPIFFGHFSFGMATVIHDPISDERRFEIQYYQVYTHNTDGLTAGTLHWSRYMGDRQMGWLGVRPVCDILIKFEPFTGSFDINGVQRSPLSGMVSQLEAMTARYRTGDGTGATYVGPANNCAQDSNQALFASLRSLFQAIEANQATLQSWLAENPAHTQSYQQLLGLQAKLYRKLQPLGSPRADWETNEFNLGTTLEDDPLRNLWTGLGSWRTLLPRKSSDVVVQAFLEYGASVWVLRTNQLGGQDPDIEPIAPMTL